MFQADLCLITATFDAERVASIIKHWAHERFDMLGSSDRRYLDFQQESDEQPT